LPDYNSVHGGAWEAERSGRLREDGVRAADGSAAGSGCHLGVSDNRHRGHRTLSPYAVGGRRLASLATQPLVVDFLDIVTRGEKGIEFRLEEFKVPEDQTIGDLRMGERTGAMILATRNKEGTFDTTPSASDRISAGDTLIVLGTREQVARLERLIKGEEIMD
jgi:Trk K+ transport system NAD-binding subunit